MKTSVKIKPPTKVAVVTLDFNTLQAIFKLIGRTPFDLRHKILNAAENERVSEFWTELYRNPTIGLKESLR